LDTNLNTNKRIDTKNKNNTINSNNNKSPRFKNKFNTENNNSPKSPKTIENGSEDSKSPSGHKIKRKNSNGSLLNSNNNKDNTLFLSKQIFKINDLFGDKNKKV
jgi:hypothetical protein